jgi:hypothetical protein
MTFSLLPVIVSVENSDGSNGMGSLLLLLLVVSRSGLTGISSLAEDEGVAVPVVAAAAAAAAASDIEVVRIEPVELVVFLEVVVAGRTCAASASCRPGE